MLVNSSLKHYRNAFINCKTDVVPPYYKYRNKDVFKESLSIFILLCELKIHERLTLYTYPLIC